MKIVIGCDHAGFELKNAILTYFNDNNIEWVDIGTFSKDSMDYPDIAHPVAKLVDKKEFDFGVLICGVPTVWLFLLINIKTLELQFVGTTK